MQHSNLGPLELEVGTVCCTVGSGRNPSPNRSTRHGSTNLFET